LDSLPLRKMIDYGETAIRWASEVGPAWADQEQVRAAVAMYVGQVGEIINHEVPLDEQAANYELFGELGGFRNRIYHHYYRDFRVDVLVATVRGELPDKVARWKATLAAIEAAESSRDA
jgi:uncharacterized protein with HEPN domain